MAFAPQVGNPGSRGQDSRYKFDPTFMYVGPDGRITDGTYHYEGDQNAMLSTDRPSVAIQGVPPADDSDSMYRFSASLRPGSGPGVGDAPAAAPRPAAPVPELQMGHMLLGQGSTPSDPMLKQTGDWSDPAQKAAFQKYLMDMAPSILERNPGLYKDQADYEGDINAFMGGNAQPLLARNQQVVPRMAMPKFNAAVNPASVAAAMKAWRTEGQPNPYGTLGPSPGRVAKVENAGRINPYGTLGPSPQRVANVKKAAVTPPALKPKSIPVKAAPPPVKKPIVAKKPVRRSGV